MDVLETKYVPLVRLHVVRERFLPYEIYEIHGDLFIKEGRLIA